MRRPFFLMKTPPLLLILAALGQWPEKAAQARADHASAEHGKRSHAESASTAANDEKPAQKGSVEDAQQLYTEGLRKYHDGQWLEALDAFTASAKLRAHPLTFYNLGLCHRSMSHYVQARLAFEQALALHGQYSRSLSAREVQELHSLIKDSDRMIAHARITIAPKDTTIAIDGRPLKDLQTKTDGLPTLAAGVQAIGPGEAAPEPSFVLLLDPGGRFFTLTKPGFQPVEEPIQFAPGEHKSLTLKLDELPAHLGITADGAGAVARIEGGNLGTLFSPTPANIQAVAGRYSVVVQKKGFVDFKAQVDVDPGQHSELRAKLSPYKPPLYKRWWFWASATAVAGGIAGLTLGLSLPPPPYQGGSTGWIVQTLRRAP